jgi:hypothetical protein
MKFLIKVQWDVEAGNAIIRSGKLASIIDSYITEHKPEGIYFASEGGKRGCTIIANVSDASKIPALAEPFFLTGNASVEFIPVMGVEDLMKAGPSIEAAVKKYA